MQGPFNIVDLFYDAAIKYPGKTAIAYRSEEISYRDFEKQVTATANYLLAKGINKGDRVLLFIPMSVDLYRIVLALFRMGAVAVFLDEWVSKTRMEECCKVAQCKALIGNYKAKLLTLFSSELRKIPVRLGQRYVASDTVMSLPITSFNDTALITFTTGSTGVPKAAKRTHGFLFEQFAALKQKLKPHPDEIDMPVLPIVLLINLGAGITSVIANYKASKPNKLRPEKIIEQLKHYKVNRIIASPFFIKQLSKYVIENKLLLPHLKRIFTGGAPVFPAEAQVYTKAFAKAEIEIVYGSTESEPISGINVMKLIKENSYSQGLNVGKVDACAQVKIIKITDAPLPVSTQYELDQLELPAREIGEIIVSGKHVLREYYNNEEAILRNKLFIGETCWHRTGDSGYFDENQHLRLTGRCNSLLYMNGKIISPFMYESYFQSIEGIELGTIMQQENKLIAIIELKKNNVKTGIAEMINANGTKFDTVIYIKEIPRDPRHNSKIDYPKLRALISRK
jgi:olefin beta-lactone synthetase